MLTPARVLFSCLCVTALLFPAAPAAAQEKEKAEKVKFTTVDGVDILGNFYVGKQKYATCILLHNIGETSRMKGWVTLAEELQKKGYSVLTFDFRGHGQSTEVNPELFWSVPDNRNYVKGAPKKTTIDYKDFKETYYPNLVNDIAAARAYLDRRNDGGACNTSSTIVIGAEQGATLGALWVNSEWHRFRMVYNPMFMRPLPAKESEGKDIIGAVWLSISPKLGSRTVAPARLVALAGREGQTPMVFLHGDQDPTGAKLAKDCEKAAINIKEKDKYKYTAASPVPKGNKLTGVGLLQKGLGTEQSVISWADDVVLAKGREWGEREWRKTQFYWKLPPLTLTSKLLPAKIQADEMNLHWDNYNRFLPP